jgi:hypothetical protein
MITQDLALVEVIQDVHLKTVYMYLKKSCVMAYFRQRKEPSPFMSIITP